MAHVHFFTHHLTDGECLAFTDEVPPPQLIGLEAGNGGYAVEVPFQRKDALRRAKSAKSALRRRIGRHRPAANPYVRTVVGPRCVNCAAREHHRRERFIRTAIEREVDLHGQQFAVACNARAVPSARRVTLRRCDHIFRTVIDYFHGLARPPGEQSRVTRDHRWILFLATKTAAGLCLHNTNTLFRQTKQARQRLVNVVRALQRAPNGDAIGSARLRDHPLRLDVELFLSAGFVLARDNEVSLAPDLIDIAFFHEERFENVVLSPDYLLARKRILDREYFGQRFDFDSHRAPRFFEQILVRVSQQHDWLFRMIDYAIRETGLVFD